jgi:transcription termination/antitermination protein NusG
MTNFSEDERKPAEAEDNDAVKPTEISSEESVDSISPEPEPEAIPVDSESQPVSEEVETDSADASAEEAQSDEVSADTATEDEPVPGSDSSPDLSSEELVPTAAAEELPVEPPPSEFKWYTLQVFTGQEEKVKKYIDLETARQGLGDAIVKIHIPTQNVVEVRGGKKKVTERVNFPGYMFIQMDINKNTRHFIRNAPSVMGFVGPEGEPVALSEPEVARIIGRSSNDDALPDMQFTVGERVRVLDGPFMDFEGTVQECLPERKRLKVLVSIFGRNTPLDLAFFQVTEIEDE